MLALPLAVPHPTVSGLRLRALTLADAPAFRAIVTRPDVGRMLFAFPSDWSLDDARALMAALSTPQHPPLRLALVQGDALIGSVGFAAGKADEIAFFLHPEYGGQGIMRAALTVFLDAVFAAFPLPDLRAVVYHDNAASLAVLSRLGFRKTGQQVATCSAQRCGAEMLHSLTLRASDWRRRR
jgi:RimJ/RimL family protein N-acetyltransferase